MDMRDILRDVIRPVSSAIPSSEVAGTGRHSIRETGPEDLGGNPPADRGPATVGALYPVTCRARYYEAASRILEDESGLCTHANADELGHVIQRWLERKYNNWVPR